jgi:predicted transport protein
LGVAASVARLISLGIQVTQSFVDFYLAYKNREYSIVHTVRELDKLFEVLETLRTMIWSGWSSAGA